MMKTKIINGKFVIGDQSLENVELCFENGVITAVGQTALECEEIVDAQGCYVAPGFIDIHVHGGDHADFLDGTKEAFLKAASLHARYGSTTILPTATSSSFEETLGMSKARAEAQKQNDLGADMPGLHIEGPYFSLEQAGAQDPNFVRNPDPKEYMVILENCPDILRWSLAPELPGAMEFARVLRERGIVVSAGHTDAEAEDMERALENGFSLLTHFYSCMSTVHRRNAMRYTGAVEAGYLFPEYDVEIIADGIHLPKELLQMIYRFIGPGRTALVTDAMRGAGMTSGTCILGSLKTGYEVIIEDGVAKVKDRSSFAGSISTTDRLVRNMVNIAQASLTDAVKMASQTPARIMGFEDRGTLEVGKRADIVFIDPAIYVTRTIVGGKTVFTKE